MVTRFSDVHTGWLDTGPFCPPFFRIANGAILKDSSQVALNMPTKYHKSDIQSQSRKGLR